MVDRSIAIRLRADVGQYLSGINRAETATGRFTQSATRGMGSLSTGAAGLGAATALGIGFAVKSYADYDKALSGVRANVDATPAQFDKLSKSIMDSGAQYGFTAKETAGAAEELAKAGIGLNDIMGGSLSGSLTLAAAGEVSVGDAAETAAMAMTIFGLKGKDVGHIADVLANGANQSTASVDSLSQALRQSGAVASSFGLELEDTVATLAMFDQNGLKGSDAGTSLKTMLTALANPSKQAAAAMDELGLAAFDANGHFVGMASLQDQLKTKTANLTDEQRNQAFATIFGSDAMRAANVLMKDDKGFNTWKKGVSEAGTAAENARTRTDNLTGDLKKFRAELTKIAIGEAGKGGGFLRTLVQGATGAAKAFGAIPAPVTQAGTAIVALGVASLGASVLTVKLVGAYRNVRTELGLARTAVRNWSTAAGGSGSIISGVRAKVVALGTSFRGMSTRAKVGIGVAAAAVLALGVALSKSGDDVENFGRTTATLEADMRKLNSKTVDTSGVFKDLQVAMNRDSSYTLTDGFKHMNSVLGESESKLGKVVTALGFGTGAASDLDAMKGRIKALGDVLGEMVASGNAAQAKTAFDQLAAAAAKGGISVDELKKMMPGYTDALTRAGGAAKETKSQTAQAADAIKDIGKVSGDSEEDVKALTEAIKGLGSAQLGERAGARDYQAAIDDATASLKENGRTLDITTEKGRKNQSAIDNIASTTKDWAAGVYESTGSMAQANAILETGRKQFLALNAAAGKTGPGIEALADSLFKLPNTVDVKLTIPNVKGVTVEIDNLGQRVYRLTGTKITVPVDSPNATQVIQLLSQVKGSATTANGTRVSVPVSGPGGADTKLLLQQIEGAALSADKKHVTIPTQALNWDETVNALKAVYNAALDRTQTITTIYRTVGSPRSGAAVGGGDFEHGTNRATGGAISGPGTSTSDSIPAWLSTGEHVLDAQDVKNMGGQAAVYTLRDMAARGWRVPGFAAGGAVGSYATGGATWQPDLSGIMSLVQSYSYDTELDLYHKLQAAQAASKKVIADLTAARAKLAEDRKKKGVPASRIIADQNRINALLADQTKRTNELTAATSKYNGVKATRRMSGADQFNSATASRNATNKKFLADLEKIRRRGAPGLALSLAQQADDDAVRMAASFAASPILRLQKAEKGLKESDKTKAGLDAFITGLTTDPKAAVLAKAQAAAQNLALQAANRQLGAGGGVIVKTTPMSSADIGRIADAVSKVNVTVPVTTHNTFDERGITTMVTQNQSTISGYGNPNPGMD